MLISKSEYQITETALFIYEGEHHFTFPEEYRSFLVKYNGDKTSETNFKAAGVSSDLRFLYGFIIQSVDWSYNQMCSSWMNT